MDRWWLSPEGSQVLQVADLVDAHDVWATWAPVRHQHAEHVWRWITPRGGGSRRPLDVATITKRAVEGPHPSMPGWIADWPEDWA